MKVLVTGFGPYRDVDRNPSGLVAEQLNGSVIDGYEVLGAVLPVSFRRALELVPMLLLEHRPAVALHLGLSLGAAELRVERVAINLMDSEKGDVDGYRPRDQPIVPGGPAAYFATIPTRRVVEELRGMGIPARLSYSAGTFLCNCVMYISLHTIAANGLNALSGFIHVPYTPELAVKKGSPSMCLHLIKEAVVAAIRVSLRSRNSARATA